MFKSINENPVEKVVHHLICPEYLPSMSWTGRGKGKEKKVALSSFIHIVNFICVTVNKIDKKLTDEKVKYILKYKILKHAPTKFGRKTNDDNPSRLSSNDNPSRVASPLIDPVEDQNDLNPRVTSNVDTTEQFQHTNGLNIHGSYSNTYRNEPIPHDQAPVTVTTDQVHHANGLHMYGSFQTQQYGPPPGHGSYLTATTPHSYQGYRMPYIDEIYGKPLHYSYNQNMTK